MKLHSEDASEAEDATTDNSPSEEEPHPYTPHKIDDDPGARISSPEDLM